VVFVGFLLGVGGALEERERFVVELEDIWVASSSRSRFGRAGERVRVDVPSPFRRGERERRGRSGLEGVASAACALAQPRYKITVNRAYLLLFDVSRDSDSSRGLAGRILGPLICPACLVRGRGLGRVVPFLETGFCRGGGVWLGVRPLLLMALAAV
jgi:hypothetical protein